MNSYNNTNINKKNEDKNSNKSANNIINKKSIIKNSNKSTKNIIMHNNNNHGKINQILKNELNNIPNNKNKNKIKYIKTVGNKTIQQLNKNSVNINSKTYNISKLFLKTTKTYNNLFIYIDKDILNKNKYNIKINNYNTKIPHNNNEKYELSDIKKFNLNRHNNMNRKNNHSLKIIKSISVDKEKPKQNNSVF